MNIHKTTVATAVAAVLGSTSYNAQAATLANGSILAFNPGTVICLEGGTPPNNCSPAGTDVIGSFFAFDGLDPGTITPNEKIPVSMNNGIIIGSAQAAGGSHPGSPDGSETPGIDTPWLFTCNTGMHQTLGAVTVVDNDVNNDGGFTKTLDFTGWSMAWNGLSSIDLGGGIQNCGTVSDGICVAANGTDIAGTYDNGSGLATITCSTTSCSASSTFTLGYAAVVPQASPSGFGGVPYILQMEGNISSVPVPAAAWLFGSGLLGLAGIARRRATVS